MIPGRAAMFGTGFRRKTGRTFVGVGVVIGSILVGTDSVTVVVVVGGGGGSTTIGTTGDGDSTGIVEGAFSS